MPYRQTQKTRERNAIRRQQIIDAARSMFAEYGYESTTMNQIVRKAGTSIGNCYFYFSNKEALLMAIIGDIIGELWSQAFERFTAAKHGVVKLGVVLYQSVTVMMKNDEIARLMAIGNSVPPVRKALFEDFTARIGELIQEDPSLHRGGDIELDMYAAHGAIMALLERRRTGEIDTSPEELALYLTRWNLRALNYTKHEIDTAFDYLAVIGATTSYGRQTASAR